MFTVALVIVTIPTLISSASPSIVIDDLPTVRTPTILASPSTNNAVLPDPTWTVPIPLLDPRVVKPTTDKFLPTLTSLRAVIIPTESTFFTSSYVRVPPTDILPVISELP